MGGAVLGSRGPNPAQAAFDAIKPPVDAVKARFDGRKPLGQGVYLVGKSVASVEDYYRQGNDGRPDCSEDVGELCPVHQSQVPSPNS